MELETSLTVAASGMRVQASRLRVVAENLANAQATASEPGGDPYRRKTVSFASELDRATGAELVTIDRYGVDRSDFVLRYMPQHPAADENGYVKFPNVNPLIELMDMREAQRSYEANLSVLSSARNMLRQTIDLLR
ncbi:MAG TPA: flagellar basal body rod protein FlgC [Rhodospirillales bacterium]|nr:flagellar basal body rod protein FlgC [Rhodospirillales bacterium]